MKDTPMKVSVVTVTYNQERYIGQALDSVLSQECDFEFEYWVGDDASTDRTPEILKEYAERHPSRLRLVLREVNVGAQANGGDLFGRCRGQYVAVLDGDDYWTSTTKLQEQVDFMDANPDCALSFHNANTLGDDGALRTVPFNQARSRYDIRDLLRGNFISSCTVMYRWGLVPALPEWWADTWIGDYPLHVLHAQHGWIGYIDKVFSTYRLHGNGLWSGEDASARGSEFLATLLRLDEELGFAYHDVVEEVLYKHRAYEFGMRCLLVRRQQTAGERREARRTMLWLVRNIHRRGDVSLKEILILMIRGTCPRLVKPMIRVKRELMRLVGRSEAETVRKGGPLA